MSLKIIPNPNREEYDEITQAVKDNDYFCPCLLQKDETTRCMCKAFKEQETEGFCHCHRYKKISVEDDDFDCGNHAHS